MIGVCANDVQFIKYSIYISMSVIKFVDSSICFYM